MYTLIVRGFTWITSTVCQAMVRSGTGPSGHLMIYVLTAAGPQVHPIPFHSQNVGLRQTSSTIIGSSRPRS